MSRHSRNQKRRGRELRGELQRRFDVRKHIERDILQLFDLAVRHPQSHLSLGTKVSL